MVGSNPVKHTTTKNNLTIDMQYIKINVGFSVQLNSFPNFTGFNSRNSLSISTSIDLIHFILLPVLLSPCPSLFLSDFHKYFHFGIFTMAKISNDTPIVHNRSELMICLTLLSFSFIKMHRKMFLFHCRKLEYFYELNK